MTVIKEVKDLYINGEEFTNAYDKAFTKLWNDEYCPWFKSKEEAEEWAKDILSDFATDFVEALGIKDIDDAPIDY